MEESQFGKRKLAVELRRRGHTALEIKADYGINTSFTNRWYGRFLRGESLQDRPRSGRTRKLSKPIAKKARVLLKRKVGGTVRRARDDLASSTGISVSHQTVWRTARREALKFRVRPKKPKLKPNHMAQRVAFARAQRQSGYWRRVFFTDEKTYGIHYEQRGQWLELSDDPEPRQTEKYGISVRVWGGVGYKGLTPLYRIPKSMTGEQYQEFLSSKVYPDMERLYGTDWIFQQDGDGSHSAAGVRAWLEEQREGWIDDWPSRSPDISIVENLWPLLGQKLIGTKVSTADGLWKRLQHEWKNLPASLCRKLGDSVPKRLKLVIQNNGGPIKY